MDSLLFASTNAGKLREVKAALSAKFLVVTPTTPIPQIIEDGQTYRANAEKKARGFYLNYKIPVLSDDSGLEIDVLGGDPGVETANFGGAELSWPERWAFVLSKLKQAPPAPWTARFRCVLCYFDGRRPAEFYEGVCEGRILPSPVGNEGFGYDPIFFSDDLQKGFALATLEEKQRVSHRGRALAAFLRRTNLDHSS